MIHHISTDTAWDTRRVVGGPRARNRVRMVVGFPVSADCSPQSGAQEWLVACDSCGDRRWLRKSTIVRRPPCGCERKQRRRMITLPDLPLGAKPTERVTPPELERVDDVQQIYCVHRVSCLDYAVAAKWESWSCVGCGAYERMSDEQIRNDVGPLINALAVICEEDR